MNNSRRSFSFLQFDLLFFSTLAVISEVMSNVLLGRWNSGFYFSFSIVLSLIAMIRWGAIGVLVGMFGGISGMVLSDMPLGSGILFYVLAQAALCIPILFYGDRSRDEIVQNPFYLLLYILVSHFCLSVGKGIIIFLLTGEITGAVDYFGATLFILFINMIVCCVLRMQSGLICDMRYYFIKKEGDGNEK